MMRCAQDTLLKILGPWVRTGSPVPIPPLNRPLFGDEIPTVIPPPGRSRGRVVYFYGCATRYFLRPVGEATVRILRETYWK